MQKNNICLFCGKEYQKSANAQKYCCEECKRKSEKQKPRNRRKIITCEVCGKEFEGNYKTKHCSMQCASIANGRRVKVICDYCGKLFHRKQSHVYENNYCSKECHNKSMEVKEIAICNYCGKEFEVLPYESEKRKFCSNECKHKSSMINIPEDDLRILYIDDDLTTRDIAHIYNTNKKIICDYLKRYNIPAKPNVFTGHDLIKCTDGHMVKSHYERAFDNALTKFNIKHEYEPVLPWNKRYHADFLIGDIYVEIWGMMEWKRYAEKRKNKLKIYKNNNAKLFSVYPEDFKNVYKIIDELKALI